MTFRIAKSVLDALPFDFAEAVEGHRQALLAHRFSGDAAPSAEAAVEQAVRRIRREGEADDFVADYEVVDDRPAPASGFDLRQQLLSALRQAEAAARDQVVGAGRMRRLGLDVARILGKPAVERAKEDEAALVAYAEIQQRLEAIQYHAAVQEETLEALSPSQLANWQWKPFSA